MLRTPGGNEIMEFQTIDHWNDKIWKKVSPVYFQAFAEKGAKPEKSFEICLGNRFVFCIWR